MQGLITGEKGRGFVVNRQISLLIKKPDLEIGGAKNSFINRRISWVMRLDDTGNRVFISKSSLIT